MALWTPANITTQLWLDASDSSTLTLSGSAVSEWRDKSGNAYHVGQPTESYYPTLTASAQNGLSVVSFSGSQQLFKNTASNIGRNTTELHCFAVRKFSSVPTTAQQIIRITNATSATKASLGSSTSPLGRCQASFRQSTAYALSTAVSSASIVTTFGMQSMSARFSAAQVNLYINGSLDGTAAISSPGPMSDEVCAYLGIGGTNQFLGSLAELIVCHVLSDDDKLKIEGYLAHKWGIQSLLPSGHTYKTSPPNDSSTFIADAASFSPTEFGTPKYVVPNIASAFIPVRFGTPKREIPYYAFVPFGPVEFGTPQLGFTDMVGEANGFVPTRFGTPNLSSLIESFTGFHEPRSFNPVEFGTPTTPTLAITVASGELMARFGLPKVQPTLYAFGATATLFGRPKIKSDSIHAAGAMSASRFGKPSVRSFVAKGVDSVRFGTPTAPIANAKGFSASRFGSPKAVYVSQPAYGFQITRFGQPRAVENLYPTDSIELGNFGVPTMYASHVVLHMWPQTQFGQPIIKRAA